MWNSWRGDVLVDSTAKLMDAARMTVAREHADRTGAYERLVQYLLTGIAMVTVASTIFQAIEYTNEAADPASLWRHRNS